MLFHRFWKTSGSCVKHVRSGGLLSKSWFFELIFFHFVRFFKEFGRLLEAVRLGALLNKSYDVLWFSMILKASSQVLKDFWKLCETCPLRGSSSQKLAFSLIFNHLECFFNGCKRLLDVVWNMSAWGLFYMQLHVYFHYIGMYCITLCHIVLYITSY